MCSANRHGLAVLALAGCASLASPARAWVETSIQSDAVNLDVGRDGAATVRHDLVVRVRGGPLRDLELAGVDGDAEPLTDATVVATDAGRVAAPLPLIVKLGQDGTLRLEIDDDDGVRRGTFRFQFGYRTNLMSRGLVRVGGARAEVRWVGPRFSQGVDSAMVVFRLPPAPEPPILPPLEGGVAGDLDLDPGGVFLGTLRRAADKDELEVVRPYVAQGEPVVWRVLADARAFGAPAASAPPAAPTPAERVGVLHGRERVTAVVAAALVALGYALLVALKWRAFTRACAARRALPRALLPLPTSLRAALAGALLVGAAAVALLTELVEVAGALLVASMLLAGAAPARLLPPLRGPGEWRAVKLDGAPANRGGRDGRAGRWLDVGTLPGFLLFALALAGIAAAAWHLLPTSPYHALLVALGSASLVPIFCTGRPSELPRDPFTGAGRPLQRLQRRLSREAGLELTLLGRFPHGSAELDELRLRVAPTPGLPGLLGLEVALEVQMGTGGAMTLPVVLVRALDGSAAHDRLVGVVRWGRGRTPEERVAVLRPKLPTASMTTDLVLRLARLLTDVRRRHRAATGAPAQPARLPTAATASRARPRREPTPGAPAPARVA